MHVLVVENDPDTREVISLSLGSAGHQVTSSGSVNEALRLLRLHRDIRLIITDIHLGGRLSGLQLVEVMRQRRHMEPCILMSGDWDSLNQDCPENVSILRKPYGREDLLHTVNLALMPPAPAAPQPPVPPTPEVAPEAVAPAIPEAVEPLLQSATDAPPA
jgi:CheY-like chemotaxis protein